MFRYVDKEDLQYKLSGLVRRELVYFEKVARIMKKRSIHYIYLSVTHYVQRLRKYARSHEPD